MCMNVTDVCLPDKYTLWSCPPPYLRVPTYAGACPAPGCPEPAQCCGNRLVQLSEQGWWPEQPITIGLGKDSVTAPSCPKYSLRAIHHKTSRTSPPLVIDSLPYELCMWLHLYITYGRVTIAIEQPSDPRTVFLDRHGKAVSDDKISREWESLQKRHGATKVISCKQLQHTFSRSRWRQPLVESSLGESGEDAVAAANGAARIMGKALGTAISHYAKANDWSYCVERAITHMLNWRRCAIRDLAAPGRQLGGEARQPAEAAGPSAARTQAKRAPQAAAKALRLPAVPRLGRGGRISRAAQALLDSGYAYRNPVAELEVEELDYEQEEYSEASSSSGSSSGGSSSSSEEPTDSSGSLRSLVTDDSDAYVDTVSDSDTSSSMPPSTGACAAVPQPGISVAGLGGAAGQEAVHLLERGTVGNNANGFYGGCGGATGPSGHRGDQGLAAIRSANPSPLRAGRRRCPARRVPTGEVMTDREYGSSGGVLPGLFVERRNGLQSGARWSGGNRQAGGPGHAAAPGDDNSAEEGGMGQDGRVVDNRPNKKARGLFGWFGKFLCRK
jgi:hypothetical protein